MARTTATAAAAVSCLRGGRARRLWLWHGALLAVLLGAGLSALTSRSGSLRLRLGVAATAYAAERQGGAELTEKTFNVPEHLSAPIKQGDVVGTVTVTMQGETVGTVDLLAGSSVDRNELLYTMAKVKAFFSSTYFKVVVVLCIIAAVVYAVLWVYVMLLTVRRVEQPTPKRKNKPND